MLPEGIRFHADQKLKQNLWSQCALRKIIEFFDRVLWSCVDDRVTLPKDLNDLVTETHVDFKSSKIIHIVICNRKMFGANVRLEKIKVGKLICG